MNASLFALNSNIGSLHPVAIAENEHKTSLTLHDILCNTLIICYITLQAYQKVVRLMCEVLRDANYMK